MPTKAKKTTSDAARAAMSVAAKKRWARVSRAAKKTAKLRRVNVHECLMQAIERERQMPQLPITDEPWLTQRQIAERLGKSIHAVRQWVRQGKLHYRRFGREVHVPLSELERFSGGYSAASIATLKAIKKPAKSTYSGQ